MIARAEAAQAWLENVTYQMCNMVRPTFVSFRLLYAYPQLRTVIQGAEQAPRWPDRFLEDVLHAVRAGHRARRCADLWWTWYHQDGYGPHHRDVPPYYSIRLATRWRGRCSGGPWCAPGNAPDAEEREVVGLGFRFGRCTYLSTYLSIVYYLQHTISTRDRICKPKHIQ